MRTRSASLYSNRYNEYGPTTAPMKRGDQPVRSPGRCRRIAVGAPARLQPNGCEWSVDRDHHVGGLDDRIGGLAAGQFELVDFFFQAEDGIRDDLVTGVQTCALPISVIARSPRAIESNQMLPPK